MALKKLVSDMPLIVQDDLNTPTLTPEEVSRLVAEPGRYQMLYILLAATGLRIGEALALAVSGVVDNCTTLQICQAYWEGRFGPPKHNSKRDVDLQESVAALLRQYLYGRTDGYVFQTRTGRPEFDHDIADDSFYALLDKVRIEHVRGMRFHAFRRFRTSVLRADAVPGKDGVPEHLISYWLGHRNKSMNDRYDFSSRRNVAWRKQWAEKAGTGFDLPLQLVLLDPLDPKLDPKQQRRKEQQVRWVQQLRE